jgi:uncharacterized protein YjbI with pentapeptide repeats
MNGQEGINVMKWEPWRTEPELPTTRQAFLHQRLTTPPDAFPFAGVTLTRADIEYLLRVHENGRGPVQWDDLAQRFRDGLDLRGADLRGVDLSHLPLARTLFGLTWKEWKDASEAEREQAGTQLQGANLAGAHLEGARCRGAHLEGANLKDAYLEAAQFRHAHLERVNLEGAFLDRTDFYGAALADEQRVGPCLRDVT